MATLRSRATTYVAVIGVVVSLALTYAVWHLETQAETNAVDVIARDRSDLFKGMLQTVRGCLEDMSALRGSQPLISQEEFKNFAQPLQKRQTSIEGCAWCPAVPAFQRPVWIDLARRAGKTEVVDTLMKGSGDSLPLWHVVENGQFPWQLGTDLFRNPTIHRQLSDAIRDRSEVALGPFPTPTPSGVIILCRPQMMDAFRNGSPVCSGFALIACNMTTLMNAALGAYGRAYIQMRLEDSDGHTICQTSINDLKPHSADIRESLSFGQRTWTLVIQSDTTQSTITRHLLSAAAALCSLFLTLIVVLGVRLQQRQSEKTQLLVTERTRELREKITDHARSSAALQRALVDNAMLASAVSSTTAGIVIIDHEQAHNPIVFINPSITATFGWTVDDVIGQAPERLLNFKDDGALTQNFTQSLTAGLSFKGETRLSAKNGTSRWTDIAITPIHGSAGETRWFVGVLTDIGLQKDATVSLEKQRDLLQRQLRFAQIFAEAAQVVMTKDEQRSLLQPLVGSIGPVLGADSVTIHEVHFAKRVLTCIAEWTAPTLELSSGIATLPLELFSQSSAHLFRARSWIDSHRDNPFPAMMSEGSAKLLHGRYGMRRVILFPCDFRSGGFSLIMVAQVQGQQEWRDDDISFLESMSHLAAVALEKARLVSQRRVGESAIRASENRYRAIVEDQSDILVRFRTGGIIAFANGAAHRYWRNHPGPLQGSHFSSLLPVKEGDELMRQLARLSPAHDVYTNELAMTQPDHSLSWLQITIRAIFDEHQQPVEFQAVCQDVTERRVTEDNLKASEASLRELLDESPEGTLLCNAQGKIIEANPSGCFLFGSARNVMMGRTLMGLAAAEEHPSLEMQIKRTRAGEVGSAQRAMLRDDGKLVPCEMITKLLPDGRLLVLLHDVSDRLRVEEYLLRAKETAEQASLAKSAFLATMSHEIRTPMNGILGMIDLLLDSPMPSDQREFAEIAKVSGEHLLNIINDILDFSKIEADRLELEEIIFEPIALIEETVGLFAEQAQGKGLELIAQIAPNMPHALRGDPPRIRQILINLVGNAVKFTTKGEIVVRVGIDEKYNSVMQVLDDDEGNPLSESPLHIWCTVSDTGPGISDENREQMFQPFSQGDTSTTRRFGGTGLGLAICRRLVELMGGTIDYETSSSGTTFKFSMELKRSLVSDDGALVPLQVRGERILVLDDNAHCGQYLHQRLTEWGLTCTVIRDPSAVLPALREADGQQRGYSLVLIDLDVPNLDSMALIRAIVANPEFSTTRVIAMSTISHRGTGYDARSAGAVSVLSKPVRSAPLLDALLATMSGVDQAEVEPSTMQSACFSGKVLVAEDNLVNRRLVLTQLQRLGLRADSVITGREALAVLERADYDLVLMDGRMPDIDGFAATAELRRREGDQRHTIVVALTADALMGDRERFIAAGMDDYLTKPLSMSALAAMLTRWLPSPHSSVGSDKQKTRSLTTRAIRKNQARTDEHVSVIAHSTHDDGLDWSRIDDIVAEGGRDFFLSLSSAFRQESQRLVEKIAAALEAGDNDMIIQVAHELRGSASSLGLSRLAQICLELEHATSMGMADVDRLQREVTEQHRQALKALAGVEAR